jgi:hypothetical protein
MLPSGGNRGAGYLFRTAIGVNIGRINEIDPGLPSMVDDARRVHFLRAATKHHGTQTDRRYPKARGAKSVIFHVWHG